MKTPYIPPVLKVVVFKMERGFADSAFKRSTEDLFIMESLDNEFRAERYSYDDWSSSPSSDEGRFNYNDWGKL